MEFRIAGKVFPFSKIEQHNLSMYLQDNVHHYSETITPTKSIPSKIFGGFIKACHTLYKFDSKAEKDFATIIEGDKVVLRWLRPAQSQFSIYWNHNSQRYVPDFVIETIDAIYMVENKAENQVQNSDVQEKAEAAEKFCATASEFNAANRGKMWSYVLIAHNEVTFDKSFNDLR